MDDPGYAPSTQDRPDRPRVVLVCGPAGAGKSTHALTLEHDGYVRLSFDEEAWRLGHREHPLPAPAVADVHALLHTRLVALVEEGHDVVVDTSFWSRASRDSYRALLAPLGVTPVVHHLATPRDEVLRRLAARAGTGPHDVVVPPDRAQAYLDGFEPPTPDEGPVVVVRPAPSLRRREASSGRIMAHGTVDEREVTPVEHWTIATVAQQSPDFRRVLWTGKHSQLVIMTIPVGGEIGEEVHEDIDQILTFVSGTGKAIVSGQERNVAQGDLVVVPAGRTHNFVNTGENPLILYTVYGPPEHAEGAVHRTKEEADAAEEAGKDEPPTQ